MNVEHRQLVWELCRQGYPLVAEEAADCLARGEYYEPSWQVRLTRRLRYLLNICNARRETPSLSGR